MTQNPISALLAAVPTWSESVFVDTTRLVQWPLVGAHRQCATGGVTNGVLSPIERVGHSGL